MLRVGLKIVVGIAYGCYCFAVGVGLGVVDICVVIEVAEWCVIIFCVSVLVDCK